MNAETFNCINDKYGSVNAINILNLESYFNYRSILNPEFDPKAKLKLPQLLIKSSILSNVDTLIEARLIKTKKTSLIYHLAEESKVKEA
jgi:hypothetical protein